MDDCIWLYIVGCEEGCKCCGYRSMNSKEGFNLMEKYNNEIQEAIKPVVEKWQKIFDDGEW